MVEFNEHGEHDNDMDYIVELQEQVSFLTKMAGEGNSALAVYRNYLERNGYGIQLLDIDKELQSIGIEQTEFNTLQAKADLFDAHLAELTELEKPVENRTILEAMAGYAVASSDFLSKAKELK